VIRQGFFLFALEGRAIFQPSIRLPDRNLSRRRHLQAVLLLYCHGEASSIKIITAEDRIGVNSGNVEIDGRGIGN
jgi:hypothetical protein